MSQMSSVKMETKWWLIATSWEESHQCEHFCFPGGVLESCVVISDYCYILLLCFIDGFSSFLMFWGMGKLSFLGISPSGHVGPLVPKSETTSQTKSTCLWLRHWETRPYGAEPNAVLGGQKMWCMNSISQNKSEWRQIFFCCCFFATRHLPLLFFLFTFSSKFDSR